MSVNKYRALKGALASGHESVAEHASFTFAVEGVSRALSHQLVRHRLASFSQQSQRYVNMDGFEYVMPESIQNSTSNIWLTSLEDFANMSEVYNALMRDIQQVYEQMVELGIPEEDARYILPNACCTNIVMSMNARELRHFFRLRCCERAQWEIRELANRMLELVKEVAPTIFADAGASCVATGRCPEGKKSCGRVKK
jgi:thymidylate synthase (FAD)